MKQADYGLPKVIKVLCRIGPTYLLYYVFFFSKKINLAATFDYLNALTSYQTMELFKIERMY